jgi:Uma2 family endonuclease
LLDHPTDAAPTPQPLITGMRMDRDEFIRRWEALPDLKRAELIEGIVYVGSPLGHRHGRFHVHLSVLVGVYAGRTPGVEAGSVSTYYMLKSAPQPDLFLRLLPECGGQTRVKKNFLHGAPELAIEISESSASYDFGPKLKLYQRAGVREYITVDAVTGRLVWRTLDGGSYRDLAADADGVFRSRVFPGLWLDSAHVADCDCPAQLALLERGFASPEHTAFVERLRASM